MITIFRQSTAEFLIAFTVRIYIPMYAGGLKKAISVMPLLLLRPFPHPLL